jgi:hypothetical protein
MREIPWADSMYNRMRNLNESLRACQVQRLG